MWQSNLVMSPEGGPNPRWGHGHREPSETKGSSKVPAPVFTRTSRTLPFMLPFAHLRASTLLRFSALVENNNSNITVLVQTTAEVTRCTSSFSDPVEARTSCCMSDCLHCAHTLNLMGRSKAARLKLPTTKSIRLKPPF